MAHQDGHGVESGIHAPSSWAHPSTTYILPQHTSKILWYNWTLVCMDPLSLAASIPGLISLTQTLLPLLIRYVDNTCSFPTEFTDLVAEIRWLCGFLCLLQSVVEKLRSSPYTGGLPCSICSIQSRCGWSFSWTTPRLQSSIEWILDSVAETWATICKEDDEMLENLSRVAKGFE